MKRLIDYIRSNPISLLLIAIPLTIAANIGKFGIIWLFIFSALGVIPLASYIGQATEVIAHRLGPRLGGWLNATLGNAAELIITIVAIRQGLLELVKASITGSILGNLLLVLGMSMLLGGIRHGEQTFDRRSASRNAILLVLSVLILLIPSLLSHYIGEVEPHPSIRVEALSLGVSGVMMGLYIMGLIYSFKSSKAPLAHVKMEEPTTMPSWSPRTSLIILGVSTFGIVYLSETFVATVEPIIAHLGISEFFIGIIFIPLIGNVAEHLVAVKVAIKDNMSLSVEICVASSLQIALFVAPVLVFISLFMNNPLTLIFNQFELLALIAGVLITALVSEDGESNWLEGLELLAIYAVLGLAFFLL